MTAYDPDNVFAKILRGELPCHKVFEDANTLAFMDVMPRCDGHCLVVPKTASRNVLDIEPAALSQVILTVQTVMQAVKIAFDADGITLQQFNEAAAGQVVFHTHFHILPRYEGIKLGPHTGEMADNDLLADHAERIRKALG